MVYTVGGVQYTRRKKIPVTGAASGAQNDYQIKLTALWEDAMQADYDDARFVKADMQTLIDAWLESKTDSTTADIWAEFPTTPADGVVETEAYMYYGNSGVASDWDIGATMLFGDDFPGSSLDTGKWNVLAGDVTVSGGNLILTGTGGTRGELNGKTSIPIGAAIYSKMYLSAANSVSTHFNALSKSADVSTRLGVYVKYTDGEMNSVTRVAAGSEATDWGSPVTPTSSHIYKNTWKLNEVKYYIDDNLKVTHTAYVPSIDLVAWLKEGTSGSALIDWTFVTKFVDNPPTAAFGTEEHQRRTPMMM